MYLHERTCERDATNVLPRRELCGLYRFKTPMQLAVRLRDIGCPTLAASNAAQLTAVSRGVRFIDDAGRTVLGQEVGH